MEEWTRWEPIKGISGKYCIDSLSTSQEGLVVGLSNENQEKIQIVFEGPIDSFRYTNESFCFKIFGDLSEQYGNDFYKDFSFFKVTNSQYLQWLSEKSRTWSDQFPFMHFCILGDDEVIDVAAYYEPIVKIME